MNAQKIRKALKTIDNEDHVNSMTLFQGIALDSGLTNTWYVRQSGQSGYIRLGSSVREALETIEEIKKERECASEL